MQGFRVIGNIKLTFKRTEVLAALEKNLVRHRVILAEAKVGYIAKARNALEKRLAAISAGNPVGLHFSLTPPSGHVRSYEAMISMLDAATDEYIELTMEQQQAFMADRWDWQIDFISSNADYSETASGMM